MGCTLACCGWTQTRAAKLLVCLTLVVVAIGVSACASTSHTSVASNSSSLESYIRRVRALSAESSRKATPSVPTVESWNPRLSAALLRLAFQPTSEQHRNVALEYRRLNILDRAYAHLDEAIRLQPDDAAAFDARARIWRDWGFAQQGLSDATRAVRLAPASAEASNTLGTLWQALGNVAEARRWYEHALMLDPNAAFAMNNLCYASIAARERNAVDTCGRAVIMAPESKDARNNLALAHAAMGDFSRARLELQRAANAAVAEYNVGILYMADRQFDKAVSAFDEALKLQPRFERAEARARQARAAAANAVEREE
jgi:Flp pilus assembly protein TadD